MKLFVGKLYLSSSLVNAVQFLLSNSIVPWIIAYIRLFCGNFLRMILVKQNPTIVSACAIGFHRISVLFNPRSLTYELAFL